MSGQRVEFPGDDVLIGRFVGYCVVRGDPKGSWQNHRIRLRIMSGFLRGIGSSLREADKKELEALLVHLRTQCTNRSGEPLCEKTIENYYAVLSSFRSFLDYEDVSKVNPVPAFRKRFLNTYKKRVEPGGRRQASVEEVSMLINSTLDLQEKTIMTVFAKTGVRKGELLSMDVGDVDLQSGCIRLKPKRKRSNLRVLFDDETAVLLARWLRVRGDYAVHGEGALFVGDKGRRIGRNIVYDIVARNAEQVGLYDSGSMRLEDHFGPHCFRHFFTTELRRNDMRREFIKELRGDSRREPIDAYDHIDFKELREEYLNCIPRLGVV